jgi:hypothetical protein
MADRGGWDNRSPANCRQALYQSRPPSHIQKSALKHSKSAPIAHATQGALDCHRPRHRATRRRRPLYPCLYRRPRCTLKSFREPHSSLRASANGLLQLPHTASSIPRTQTTRSFQTSPGPNSSNRIRFLPIFSAGTGITLLVLSEPAIHTQKLRHG